MPSNTVILTFKIMPESVDFDLKKIKKECESILCKMGNIGKSEENEVAFGLKELLFYVLYDETKGSTEETEKALAAVKGVGSAEITDVRREIDTRKY